MRDRGSFLLLLYFVLMAALYLEASNIRNYLFPVTTKMTWSSARLYCQKYHNDLISFEIVTKQELGPWLVESDVKQLWMGKHRDSWNLFPRKSVLLWTASKNETRPASNVSTSDDEDCALYDSDTEQMRSTKCNKKHAFVCLGDNLKLVMRNETWEGALQHCKNLEIQCEQRHKEPCKFTFSLLNMKQSDYDYVRDRISRAKTPEIWTGLRFLGGHWFWLDGTELEDEGLLPHCPSDWNHCGTLSKNDTENWITRDCSEKRNFICIRGRKEKET